MRRAAALALCLGLLAPPAGACDLALILAIDVSGSVDPREYRIQIEGLAEGLRDGVVAEALVTARAELMLIQWTGESRQVISLPWTPVHSFEDLEAFADRVAATSRKWRNFSTAIGEALELALEAFAEGPDCRRRVVDISGDGSSNEGRAPAELHEALAAAGVTVNALVIEGSEENLTAYFRAEVITGPGAFAMPANGYDDYPERIRLKLRRETARAISLLRAPPERR